MCLFESSQSPRVKTTLLFIYASHQRSGDEANWRRSKHMPLISHFLPMSHSFLLEIWDYLATRGREQTYSLTQVLRVASTIPWIHSRLFEAMKIYSPANKHFKSHFSLLEAYYLHWLLNWQNFPRLKNWQSAAPPKSYPCIIELQAPSCKVYFIVMKISTRHD